MADYRVLVADLISNTIREEIPLSDLRWSLVLNAPGTLTGTIPLDHPKATRANLDPGGTAIYLERGGLLVWGGILWGARASTRRRIVEITAAGFWSYLRRRRIRHTKTYTGQDQLAIARDLVTYAQSQPGGNLGIVTGGETSGVTRDRTYYHYERKSIGEAIEQLAAVQNGFDFAIEVQWDATGTTPEKHFRLYYPRRGTRLDTLIWNHNVAGVADVTVSVDATRAANQIDALGEGDADAMLIATASDTSVLARYPLLDDAISHKDIKESATLQAHAESRLAALRVPVETPEITTQADIWPAFGSYQLGDEGLVIVDDGWIQVSSYWRVHEIRVSVDDDGTETVIPRFATGDALT